MKDMDLALEVNNVTKTFDGFCTSQQKVDTLCVKG